MKKHKAPTIDQVMDKVGSFPNDSDRGSKRFEAYFRHLRQRASENALYTHELVLDIRKRASEKTMEKARKSLEEASKKPLVMGRFNPLLQLKTEDLFLAASPEWLAKTAHLISEKEIEWTSSPWGLVHALSHYIIKLLALPECTAAHIEPFFIWLVDYLPSEWEMARKWNEHGLGNSGHNWYLNTFTGFYLAGLYFSEVNNFKKFKSFMPTYFEHEMNLLMERDGFSKERSGYHYGTVFHHWFFVVRLMEVADVSPSESFKEKLKHCADTLWKMIAPYGTSQLSGDTNSNYGPGRNILSLRQAAGLLHNQEAKFVAEKLQPDWEPEIPGILLVFGKNVYSDYQKLKPKLPENGKTDTELPYSGYYFMRDDWTSSSNALCIEAGSLGNIVNSHNHNNVHHIELHSYGTPILIDNGPGPYGGGFPRLWRVSSASHNVVTVDGIEPVPLQNEWRWQHTIIPTIDSWISREKFAYFSSSHEGYSRLQNPVVSCKRIIFYLRGEYWILIDRFTASTEHTYEQHFQIKDNYITREDGTLITQNNNGNLLIKPVRGLSGRLHTEKCPAPIDEHDNPDHITYTKKSSGNIILVTLLVPFKNKNIPEAWVKSIDVHCDGRILDPWEATGLEIRVNNKRHIFFNQHMQWNLPWETGGYCGDTRLFHSEIL